MAAIRFLRNEAIPTHATSGRTSTVGEPSLAKIGNSVFFSGNWYASQSNDGGATWSHVDPFTTLPPADLGFCCDQTVIYDPSRDITIWLLQYRPANATNTLRVAVRKTGGAWHWWDFRPTTVNPAFTDVWFDYNSAALSSNFLYVTSNVFDFSTPREKFKRSVVLRFRLDALAAGGNLPFNSFTTTENGSLRCTLGATTVMYFASHNSNRQLRLFTWPESSTSVSARNIDVAAWNMNRPYSAPCGPQRKEWLSRTDGRITGAWLANGEIGFAWTSNSVASRPWPYIRVVKINEATKRVVSQPDIWSANHAYAYPDACPNANGVVGMSLFRGGGARFPGHVVGVLDGNTWQLAATRDGTNAPLEGKWGDYVACRRDAPVGHAWVASGFTLQGGEDRANVEPRFVHFEFT